MSEALRQEDWVEQRVEEVRRLLEAPPAPEAAAAPPLVKFPPRTAAQLAPLMEHTLLRPDATPEAVLRVVEEAQTHRMAGVCVNAWHVPRVADALVGSNVRVVAVVGFPLGATFPVIKAAEAAEAVRRGAQEVDTVVNVGALRAGLLREVLDDLRAVVEGAGGRPVKVILETHLLSPEERAVGCALAELAGAAYVKTSTGFSGGGATVEDVLLMRRAVGDRLAVKASGGIRSAETGLALTAAGAQRLGTSASVSILLGGTSGGAY